MTGCCWINSFSSGVKRLEVTSFVRADVIPQLADGPEVLERRSIEISPPGPSEVRVRVRAVAMTTTGGLYGLVVLVGLLGGLWLRGAVERRQRRPLSTEPTVVPEPVSGP